MSDHDDFAFDHAPGLPAPLPPGEALLWQGSPDWRALARRPFRCRAVAAWFALVLAWHAGSGLYRGEGLGELLPGLALTLLGGALAVGILAALAWLTARATIWSITERRLLIRFGIALPVTMNLPFVRIASAALALHGARSDAAPAASDAPGTGDIVLELVADERVSWAVMWPHVGPFGGGRTRPALRAVPDAARVARLLGEAVVAAGGHEAGEVVANAPAPVPATAPAPAPAPVAVGGRARERAVPALGGASAA